MVSTGYARQSSAAEKAASGALHAQLQGLCTVHRSSHMTSTGMRWVAALHSSTPGHTVARTCKQQQRQQQQQPRCRTFFTYPLLCQFLLMPSHFSGVAMMMSADSSAARSGV